MTRFLFFEAPWCATCHQVIQSLYPRIIGLPLERHNVVNHDSMLLANHYYVRHLPTLIVLNDGHVVDFIVGSSIANWTPHT